MVTSSPAKTDRALCAEADIAELASVWAVMNALSEEASASEGAELAEMRTVFDRHLKQLDLTQVNLFDYVADSVEKGNWEALGLPDPED